MIIKAGVISFTSYVRVCASQGNNMRIKKVSSLNENAARGVAITRRNVKANILLMYNIFYCKNDYFLIY